MALTFRKKGIRKEVRNRILLLVAVFFAALVLFLVLYNVRLPEKQAGMSAPVLPTVSMEAHGTRISCLHGYTEKMDALYMRDAVVPVDESRVLPLFVTTYGADVSGISYEIRSLDTERKITDEKITDYKEENGEIRADVPIVNLVDTGEEYLFVLTLRTGGRDVRYYTRIVIPEDAHEADCMQFAETFHERALAKDTAYVADYLETDGSEEDTAQLSDVTIHSTAAQAAWGSFDGTVTGTPVMELKDISADYNVIVFYYMMERNGGSALYNVEEYFKVRWTSLGMYLIDYNRTMNQILDPSTVSAADGSISLGVMEQNGMTYLSNEIGTVVAFVQDGDLWEYNVQEGTLTSVFSFRNDGNPTDVRTNYGEHRITILNIDENGTMDFAVYGYMNAGKHEGSCGIDLFHYDCETGTAKEQTFIESTKSYQILNAGFSDLLYKTAGNSFYIMVDGTLLSVDLETLETKEVLSGLRTDQYAASSSGRYFAWMDTEKPGDSLTVIDLETGKRFRIAAGEGQLVRPLAFLDEDLVYGIITSSDIRTDAAGTEIWPMADVVIADVSDGSAETIKEYTKPGFYVTDAVENNGMLYLSRVTWDGTKYVAADDDTIRNSTGAKNRAVTVALASDAAAGETVSIQLSTSGSVASIVRPAEAPLVYADEMRTVSVRAIDSETRYYVYVGSRVIWAGSDVTRAISEADAEMGIVVDNTQRYIWKRGRQAYRNTIQDLAPGQLDRDASGEAAALSALISFAGESVDVHSLLASGETLIDVLQNTLKDRKVLDLSGCTLSEVLWYVSTGTPVYAATPDGAYLIAGYDAVNVTVYDPTKNDYETMTQEKAEALFNAAGNVYITYVD